MPAPPPESEPAMVRQRGITAGEASIAPMAIVTWDGLLQGDELAYRTEIPARRADVVPIPDGLHPRVLDSLAGLGLDGLDRNREREDPGLQPARPERARRGAEAPRPLPLSDEGPRTGPGPSACSFQ